MQFIRRLITSAFPSSVRQNLVTRTLTEEHAARKQTGVLSRQASSAAFLLIDHDSTSLQSTSPQSSLSATLSLLQKSRAGINRQAFTADRLSSGSAVAGSLSRHGPSHSQQTCWQSSETNHQPPFISFLTMQTERDQCGARGV